MIELKLQPTAYEWHNYETGHCYVDYIERKDYEDAWDYTKTPLYKLNDVKLLWQYMTMMMNLSSLFIKHLREQTKIGYYLKSSE